MACLVFGKVYPECNSISPQHFVVYVGTSRGIEQGRSRFRSKLFYITTRVIALCHQRATFSSEWHMIFLRETKQSFEKQQCQKIEGLVEDIRPASPRDPSTL